VSVDKRSVHTDALATLGTIIDDTQARDAIHLAVEPVIAAHLLQPGDDVGLLPDGSATTDGVKLLGIVDPFLKEPVGEGERFWLVVYPRQITSLRHVWEHADFPASDETKVVARSKDESEKWLRDFIDGADCPGYETVIAAALDNSGSWDPEYLHFRDRDAHGDIPPEFWDHLEVVTGRTIPQESRAKYFSCAC
jgi:hypothetical protein